MDNEPNVLFQLLGISKKEPSKKKGNRLAEMIPTMQGQFDESHSKSQKTASQPIVTVGIRG